MGLALFMLFEMLATFSYNIVYMYTSELFPTYTRNSMHSICSAIGRVGSLIAPQTPLLVGISLETLICQLNCVAVIQQTNGILHIISRWPTGQVCPRSSSVCRPSFLEPWLSSCRRQRALSYLTRWGKRRPSGGKQIRRDHRCISTRQNKCWKRHKS